MFYNTFHIYNDNAPIWDNSKPFIGQDTDTQLYFTTEFIKLKKGVSWGATKIHPWTYWHINYFKLPIDEKNEDGTEEVEVRLGDFRDNEILLNEILLRADALRKGIIMVGTRRFTKSAFLGSFTSFNCTTKIGGEARPCVLNGGSVSDLKNITSYIDTGMKNIHPMFNIYPPVTTDYFKSGVKFGYKDTKNVSTIHAMIKVNNLKGGTQKTAGDTPIMSVFDEIGKYHILTHFNVNRPALETQYGWRTPPILVGTGGDIKLVKPAESMMLNPATHKLLEMDWSILDKHAKSNITWTSGIKCGIFVPAQYALKFPKLDSTLGDYMDNPEPYLKKIKIKVTDFERANKILDKEEEEARQTSSKTLLDLQTHYPRSVAACFMSNNTSPFPIREATEHKVKLESSGNTYNGYDISIGENGHLEKRPSSKDLAPYPFGGGNIECPVQIFIEPPKKPKFSKLFIGGLDYYKQKESGTSSVGAFYILKRMGKIGDKNSYKIAASYASRPEDPEDFDVTTYMLQLGYGAITLQEAADTGYETYLKRKKVPMMQFLAEGKKVSQTNGKLKQEHVKFGLYPTPENKEHVLRAVIKYCQEEVEIVEEIDGEEVSSIKKGVYRIDDIQLLEEIISYDPTGGNYDRIVAFGHALVWAQYLDSIYNVPEDEDDEKEEDEFKVQRKKSVNIKEKKIMDSHYIRSRRQILERAKRR